MKIHFTFAAALTVSFSVVAAPPPDTGGAKPNAPL